MLATSGRFSQTLFGRPLSEMVRSLEHTTNSRGVLVKVKYMPESTLHTSGQEPDDRAVSVLNDWSPGQFYVLDNPHYEHEYLRNLLDLARRGLEMHRDQLTAYAVEVATILTERIPPILESPEQTGIVTNRKRLTHLLPVIIERDGIGWHCTYCGCRLIPAGTPKGTKPYYVTHGGDIVIAPGYERVVIDHVVPLARGGSNDIDNLVTCCWRCNHRKGIRTGDEFRTEIGQEQAR